MNRNVGRIVPYRYSLVTSMIPARAEKTPAKLPTLNSIALVLCVGEVRVLVSRPVSSEKRRMSPTIPSTRPTVVRVDRIFNSSALNWPVMRLAPS